MALARDAKRRQTAAPYDRVSAGAYAGYHGAHEMITAAQAREIVSTSDAVVLKLQSELETKIRAAAEAGKNFVEVHTQCFDEFSQPPKPSAQILRLADAVRKHGFHCEWKQINEFRNRSGFGSPDPDDKPVRSAEMGLYVRW